MNIKTIVASLMIAAFSVGNLSAQESNERKISVDELFSLVKENHPNLAVSRADVAAAKQSVEVAKDAQLPNINMGLQAYYLGDALLIDKNFSNSKSIKMPHFGNTFSVDASQLIWKGGLVKNGIAIQSLKEELAELNYQANVQNIKLLAVSYYLDLYKLFNQKNVYEQNIQLADLRLGNINKFYTHGMVTRNDVIRGELQLSNLKLALDVVNNNIEILNKQLTTALGLPESTKIIIDEATLNEIPKVLSIEDYKSSAMNTPTILMTKKAVDIYQTSEKVVKAEMMPSLSAFAGNKLARPITTSMPPVDMYTNGWSAGLSLNFNIDALYKTPKKIKQVHLEKDKALAQVNEAEKMTDVAVKAAYIKYNEALTQNNTLETNRKLAEENYRIMNSKYNNQLVILLDLIDASNQKLDAELQYANSEIGIIYSYYKLLKESGNL